METPEQIKKQEAMIRHQLALIAESIDDAAEAGDEEALIRLASEQQAKRALLEACSRRMEKALAGISKAEIAEAKAANLKAADTAIKELEAAQKLAPEVDRAMAQFLDVLERLEGHAKAAGQALHLVTRQLLPGQRQGLVHLLDAPTAGIGRLVENVLASRGLFDELAPHHNKRLEYFDKTVTFTDGFANYKKRIEFAEQAKQLAQRVNATLED